MFYLDDTKSHSAATSQTAGALLSGPVFDTRVSLFKSACDAVGTPESLRDVLRLVIADPWLAERVSKLRKLRESSPSAYVEARKTLRAFTGSGTFSARSAGDLESYSGILTVEVLDLKKRGTIPAELKATLAKDAHVLFSFIAPCGDGLIVGFMVSTAPESIADGLFGIENYLAVTHGLRPNDTGKDVALTCFLSSDSEIHVNPEATPLDIGAWQVVGVTNPDGEEDEDDSAFDDENHPPLDALPPLMQELATTLADVYRVSPALPAAAAQTVLAASLGGNVSCNSALSGRVVPANLYTIIGAPSTYGKSVIQIVANPLIEESKSKAREFELHERPRLLTELAIAKKKKGELLSKTTGDDWTQAEADEIKAQLIRLEVIIEDRTRSAKSAPTLFSGSATSPALAMAMKRNKETLLSLALEAGDATRVAAGDYTPSGKPDFDLLLSGFTREPYGRGRVGPTSVTMDAPCLSLLWSVQPPLLNELFAIPDAKDRGLFGRINFLECRQIETPLDDGIYREFPPSLDERWRTVIVAALRLREDERNIVFNADAGAREVFREFNNESVTLGNGELRESKTNLNRCREKAIRLAIGIAAFEWLLAGGVGDNPVLTMEHAARGVAWARFYLNAALRLSAEPIAKDQQKRLTILLQKLNASGGKITLRKLRKHHGFSEAEVRAIVGRNPEKLAIKTATPSKDGGRPSPCLVLLRSETGIWGF